MIKELKELTKLKELEELRRYCFSALLHQLSYVFNFERSDNFFNFFNSQRKII